MTGSRLHLKYADRRACSRCNSVVEKLGDWHRTQEIAPDGTYVWRWVAEPVVIDDPYLPTAIKQEFEQVKRIRTQAGTVEQTVKVKAAVYEYYCERCNLLLPRAWTQPTSKEPPRKAWY